MAANHNAVSNTLGSAPISNAAYTQIFGGSTPQTVTRLTLSNSTDQNVTIAAGAAGSEVDFFTVAKGCQAEYICQPNQFPVTTRFALIAQGAATSSGSITVTLV
jgi:hypothetical protein